MRKGSQVIFSVATSLAMSGATLGSAAFTAPAFAAECNSFGGCKRLERRMHCVWKTNKIGISYKSCAAQHRTCSWSRGNPQAGTKPTPEKCGAWKNSL